MLKTQKLYAAEKTVAHRAISKINILLLPKVNQQINSRIKFIVKGNPELAKVANIKEHINKGADKTIPL